MDPIRTHIPLGEVPRWHDGCRKDEQERKIESISALVLPLLHLTFTISEHYGLWDEVRGLNAIKKVATQMSTSYDSSAQRRFRPQDDGWKPTLALIKRYTPAALPRGKDPVVIARYVAVLSGKADLGGGKIAEWTAPTTPLYLLYHDLPAPLEEAIQVGTIGDLYVWVEKSKNDFRFYVQNIILGLFALVLAVLIWSG